MKSINIRLKRKLNDVFMVEPNDLGLNFLTFIYKKTTVFLKTLPFIVIIPVSIIAAVIIYFILGRFAIRLVTILQYGF